MTTPRICNWFRCRRAAHVSPSTGVVFGLCDEHLGQVLAFDTGHALDVLGSMRNEGRITESEARVLDGNR